VVQARVTSEPPVAGSNPAGGESCRSSNWQSKGHARAVNSRRKVSGVVKVRVTSTQENDSGYSRGDAERETPPASQEAVVQIYAGRLFPPDEMPGWWRVEILRLTDGGAVRFAARLKDSSRFVFGADSNSPRSWKSNSGIENAPASEGGRYTGREAHGLDVV
jgi:hypothetical protein